MPDADTETGLRVNMTLATLPAPNTGTELDASVWNYADGFSPGAAILVHLPGASDEIVVRRHQGGEV